MGDSEKTGSLAGLKVVDLTRVLGGPYCTQILADHGAEVIKVEPPQGDEVRDWGPPFQNGDASYFIGINRNKRSIGLDLSTSEGRAVLLTLVEHADVLIENFKPGAMESWGMGYEEDLSTRFPRLVYCKVSGFGADGPLGGYPGYDGIIQAMAGWISINGAPDSGPTRLGIPMVDMGTGLFCTVGILMALREREHSGRGQYLDMALYDCAIALMHPHFPNFLLSGNVPQLSGNPHPNISPYDKFSTRTCDVFIGAGNDRAFRRLCAELGAVTLAEDPRFASNQDRVANRESLTAEIARCLAEIDGEALSLRLLGVGLTCGPVLDVRQALEAEQTAARGMIVEEGDYRGIATPIKLSRTPGRFRSSPPQFSQHTRDILQEHGFTSEQVAVLAATEVLVEKRRNA